MEIFFAVYSSISYGYIRNRTLKLTEQISMIHLQNVLWGWREKAFEKGFVSDLDNLRTVCVRSSPFLCRPAENVLRSGRVLPIDRCRPQFCAKQNRSDLGMALSHPDVTLALSNGHSLSSGAFLWRLSFAKCPNHSQVKITEGGWENFGCTFVANDINYQQVQSICGCKKFLTKTSFKHTIAVVRRKMCNRNYPPVHSVLLTVCQPRLLLYLKLDFKAILWRNKWHRRGGAN